MTEEDWFAIHERELPRAIVGWSPRRQRLLAVAVCRALGTWIDYPEVHAALEAVERFADTDKTKAALRRARESIVVLRNQLVVNRPSDSPSAEDRIAYALFVIQVAATENAVSGTVPQAIEALVTVEGISEEAARRRLFDSYREVAGPDDPPALASNWRTGTAVALARQMYESRDFGAMPILADALQDAGCDDEGILAHCRDSGATHVRGCWVVDLVLGKE